ncbi:Dof zinc finger protein [Vigna angularis]|uniref:Dof zinc finger protein n=1 Tax=Phaseolus angularis TaxID=3914 RepID=A0A8T0KKE7_PHAAN|nr:Dof zinc finger protein [Vigna angularis]
MEILDDDRVGFENVIVYALNLKNDGAGMTCRRYWTKGGALRNVPIGGGCWKNKNIGVANSIVASESGSGPNLERICSGSGADLDEAGGEGWTNLAVDLDEADMERICSGSMMFSKQEKYIVDSIGFYSVLLSHWFYRYN